MLSVSVAAHEREAKPVMDLRYGQALYHFYQEQYFSSITELMVANARKPITAQGIDPELLMGGLYLYYGLHQDATRIFNRLIEHHTEPETQDRAWFNIGKMEYHGHLYEQAKTALLKVTDTLTPEREAERNNMLANIYFQEKDFKSAYPVLEQLREHNDWEAYARYNLGIALIRDNQVEEGTRTLNDISNMKTTDAELKVLRDKTNIALGYALIKDKQPVKALKYFQKVRLHGPLSAKALLGTGWAYQMQHKAEKALVPWMELRNWPVIDTAVQESLLAIPYTLENMGKKRLALNHYRYAVANYEKELGHLAKVIKNMRNGDFIRALRPAMITEQALDPEYRKELPESISIPYLYYLLDSIDFQQTHKNYLDLVYLVKNLQEWKHQFPAYRLMLKERKNHYNKMEQATRNDTRLKKINRLKKLRNQLAAKVQQIEEKHDIYALASEEEKEVLETLDKAEKTLHRIKGRGDFSDEQQKYRFFRGLMLWQISTDYAPRLWKVKSQLIQLDRALTKAEQQIRSVKYSIKTAPRAFTGFSKRIEIQEKKLDQLIRKTTSILALQEKHILEHALEALEKRYQQIKKYQVRARYSLARLYDSLTLPQAQAVKKENKNGSSKK